MTECVNITMRDALPELVSGELSAAEQARVSAHVATCAPCAEERDVLAQVFRARPVAPSLDIAAIVAALPHATAAHASVGASASARQHTPRLQLVTGGLGDAPTAHPAVSGRSDTATPSIAARTRRRTFRTAWRLAAALAVVSVGTLSVSVARRGLVAITEADSSARTSLLDSVTHGPPPDMSTLGTVPGDASVSSVATPTVRAVSEVAPALLPVNELSDFTDAELTQLLASLEAWDGASAVEPVRSVTVVDGGLLPEEL